MSSIGELSITPCRAVNNFSGRQGNEKVAGVLGVCLGEKWEGVGMKIQGTKNLVVDKHKKNFEKVLTVNHNHPHAVHCEIQTNYIHLHKKSLRDL